MRRPLPGDHDWWRAFQAPVLDHLIDQALASNPTLGEARQRLQAASAIYARRHAPYLPSLRIKTDEPIDPDASASYFIIGFNARWNLGLFGRAKATARVDRGHVLQAADQVRKARVALVAAVVHNWIDLHAAQQQARVLQHIAVVQQRQLKLLHVRLRLGLLSQSDIGPLQANLADIQVKQARTRHAAQVAAQQLAVLLARAEPDPAWMKPAALPALDAPAPVAVPSDMLHTRPDIALAQAHLVSAAGELGLARADLYPSIGLGGSLLASTDLASYRNDSTNAIGALGPIIDIPLFDWGLRKSRARAKRHALQAAVLAYRKAVLQGVADVETALDSLRSTQQQQDARKRAWQALEHTATATGKRAQLGLDSTTQRLRAVDNLDQERVKWIAARARHAKAYVALYQALGGGSVVPALVSHEATRK